MKARRIYLVACAKTKRPTTVAAKSLYQSELFRESRRLAEKEASEWYILSAKYGLLDPEAVIGTYDETLNRMPVKLRQRWGEWVLDQLQQRLARSDTVVFLAGERYREFIGSALEALGFAVEYPLAGLPLGQQISRLKSINSRTPDPIHLEEFYQQLLRLRRGQGGGRRFASCTGRLHWPKRGVYFIFEETEFRARPPDLQRVVRIGTHAVSRGSKTTLWDRLSTHRGTSSGAGSHRSSIFRLHVGAALMSRFPTDFLVTSWGQGQTTDAQTRQLEAELEVRVSDYIGRMSVLWIDVTDEPSPWSDRAYVERNAIALLTQSHTLPDPPSPGWLGLSSPRPEIRESGLWNINYLFETYDERFVDIFTRYVDITLGYRTQPNQPIAPKGWYALRDTTDSRQLSLL